MVCFKCGNTNDNNSIFCAGCGYRFALTGVEDFPFGETNPLKSDSEYIEHFKEKVAERYTIERELGRGIMAVVFLAEDRRLERKVAIKLLHPEIYLNKSFLEKFTAVINLSSKLIHPNIVKIYNVDKNGDFYYYSMSYVEGRSLADILLKFGQLYSKLIVRFSFFICNALAHAHSYNIIHRDIRLENIIIDNSIQPVILDFGITHAFIGTNISQSGSVAGTPLYISPEQINGNEIDCRADIYSLGCLMYHMAAGVAPFQDDDSASALYKHVHQMPVPPNECNDRVPEWLSLVITKAMAKNPENRYQSANELSKILYKYFVKRSKFRKSV